MEKNKNAGVLFGKIDRNGLKLYSPLELAYIGDAVFELMMRRYEAGEGGARMDALHRRVVSHVRAPAQAKAAAALDGLLTAEEAEIFKKGRNAHVSGIPKGATPAEYGAATALESLFGYLYLAGEFERLEVLFAACLEE